MRDKRRVQVDTPFGPSDDWHVSLIVEGYASAGYAHGDGILRQAVEFELDPMVFGTTSFVGGPGMGLGQPVDDVFQFENRFGNLFFGYWFCLTCVPPADLSFHVSVEFVPSLCTFANLPPAIDPNAELGWEGFVVDVPIVGNLTEAYLVLEGPGIIPELQSWLLIVCGTMVIARHLFRP